MDFAENVGDSHDGSSGEVNLAQAGARRFVDMPVVSIVKIIQLQWT